MHTDDLIPCSRKMLEIDYQRRCLCKEFLMQNLGLLKYFLCINIIRVNTDSLELNEKQCFWHVLYKFDIHNFKSVAASIEAGLKLERPTKA